MLNELFEQLKEVFERQNNTIEGLKNGLQKKEEEIANLKRELRVAEAEKNQAFGRLSKITKAIGEVGRE